MLLITYFALCVSLHAQTRSRETPLERLEAEKAAFELSEDFAHAAEDVVLRVLQGAVPPSAFLFASLRRLSCFFLRVCLHGCCSSRSPVSPRTALLYDLYGAGGEKFVADGVVARRVAAWEVLGEDVGEVLLFLFYPERAFLAAASGRRGVQGRRARAQGP
jgi:hypothetical protein